MKFYEYFDLDSVTINVTNDCQLHCIYCFEDNKNKQKLSNEQIEVIIDKCYANHLKNHKNKLAISFFGGEPLLNFEVIKHCMNYCKQKEYNVTAGITTNLVGLTDEMIEIIANYDLGVLVSIDGIKEIHDKNRCNSYDIVKKNVSKMIDKGLAYLIEARMTVMPNSLDNFFESVKSIYDLGIYNIAPVPVSDTKWNEEDFVKFEKELDKIWDWVISVYNDENNKINLSVKLIEDYLETVLTLNASKNGFKALCAAGSNKSISIGGNGEIMPCHQRHTVLNHYSELIMGNIFSDDEIKDINFNQNPIISEKGCENCKVRNICKGGCPSENLSVNNNSNYLNKTQCKIYEIIGSIALKKQEEIYNSKNLRSHRLNILKENMKLYKQFEDLFKGNYDVYKWYNFYERLTSITDILLPSYKQFYQEKLQNLKL